MSHNKCTICHIPADHLIPNYDGGKVSLLCYPCIRSCANNMLAIMTVLSCIVLVAMLFL